VLDDPASLKPDRHIFVAEKMPWIAIGDDLPQFEFSATNASPMACPADCGMTGGRLRISFDGWLDSDIQRRYRVYCLATEPANTLMWSHYAEKHTGICLEYRCDDGVFSTALKVVYCETYPRLDLADDNPDTLLLPLLTKAEDWSYEDEYRLIAQEESEALNHRSLITKNNRLKLPDGALTSIIVGCLAPLSTGEAVVEIVKSSGHPIELQEARRASNHYSLTVGGLTLMTT
jgi:hypothetical protein